MKLRLVFIIILSFACRCYAQNVVEPFHTHNQSPLVHFFGFPNNYGGKVLEQKEFVFGNYFNIANNATSTKLRNEAIYLDGEMYRNEIVLRYGLLKKLQVEFTLPLVKHSTGIMDPFISGWHEAFGLPGKAREIMPEYGLTYMYRENETIRLNMSNSKIEIGDISFRISTPLLKKKTHLLSLGGFVKFATGEKKELIGSGTNDFGVHLSGRFIPEKKEKGFTCFYSGGYMRIGSGAVLSKLITKDIVFGNLGLAYQLSRKWIPKVQFDFHTGFYKNSLAKQLEKESIQLVIGTDYLLSDKLNLSISFTEDFIVNTAPDFVVQLGVSYKL
ncbi:MAG: DUF3187 family protein [Marinifilum sp.]|jgi:hypothetical protein|nr:DUF3187 family protein [Marinifilum sp.]